MKSMVTRRLLAGWLGLAVALLWTVAAYAQGGSGAAYRDPQGRFSVRGPAGWVIQTRGDDYVSIQHRSSYTDILFQDNAPAEAVANVEGQLRGRWSKFQEIKRGTMTIGGRQAEFAFCSGTNGQGVPEFLKVVAASLGNESIILMSISPESDYPSLRAAFEQIEQSVTLGGGGNGGAIGGGRPNRGNSNGGGGESGGGNSGPLAALEQACRTGVLTPEECAEKKRKLAQQGKPAPDPKRLAALEQACRSGVLTPEECEAKRHALTGTDSGGGPAPIQQEPQGPDGPMRGPARAAMGILFHNVSPQEAQQMGLEDSRGVLIQQVVPGGPAAQAGLLPGDLLVALNRTAIASGQDVVQLMSQRNPGDVVELIVLRNGKPRVYKVTLGAGAPQ